MFRNISDIMKPAFYMELWEAEGEMFFLIFIWKVPSKNKKAFKRYSYFLKRKKKFLNIGARQFK